MMLLINNNVAKLRKNTEISTYNSTLFTNKTCFVSRFSSKKQWNLDLQPLVLPFLGGHACEGFEGTEEGGFVGKA